MRRLLTHWTGIEPISFTQLLFIYAVIATHIGSWRPRRVLPALFGPEYVR